MVLKIPAVVRAAMAEIARKTGALGGKTAAKNMSPKERSVRAKKASMAAAKMRTEKRLASAKKKPSPKKSD